MKKKEIEIFVKYCKKYKLFGFFILFFIIMFLGKLIMILCFKGSNEFFDLFYTLFLGLSMSALFYYWIEYKREYKTIERNKEKVLENLNELEKRLEDIYTNKRHYKILWSYYLEIFDFLESLLGITFEYNWFETSYVESIKIIQIQDYYKFFKRKKDNILEQIQIGEELSMKNEEDFSEKLENSIKFNSIKNDIFSKKKRKESLSISSNMKTKIEEITGKRYTISGLSDNNTYYKYCEEEILIIQSLLLIIYEIKKVVKKLEI